MGVRTMDLALVLRDCPVVSVEVRNDVDSRIHRYIVNVSSCILEMVAP